MVEENQLVKHLFQHQDSQDMVDFTDWFTPKLLFVFRLRFNLLHFVIFWATRSDSDLAR
jgi:hypothetical protein